MLLHEQKSLYRMDAEEKENLKDMVLVAINELTKFEPGITDEDRDEFGVEFSNIAPFNPGMIEDVLIDLGYKEGELDAAGWEHDYQYPFTHPDKKHFPPVKLAGTAWIHECKLHGTYDDYESYPHLEDNPEYACRIKHGKELLAKAMDRK